MRTYKRAITVLLCLIAAVCLATVVYTVVGLNADKHITITYGPPAESAGEETGLVNINTADKDELMKLEGIGEAKACAIIEYREANGPFEKVEDLLNVEGIGQKILDSIREYVIL